MAPAIAAILRGLLPRAGASAAAGSGARVAAGKGAQKGAAGAAAGESKGFLSNVFQSFVGGGDPNKPGILESIKDAIGAGVEQKAENRVLEATGAEKPQVDFGSLIAEMGNKNALQDAQDAVSHEELAQKQELQRATEAEAEEKEKLIPVIKRVVGIFTKGLGPLAKIVAVGATFLLTLKLWTNRLEASRRHLEHYNGAIAGSFAILDAQKIQQGIQKSRATQVSTVRLNRDIEEFREAMLPLENLVRTYGNTIATLLLRLGTGAARGLNMLTQIPGALGPLITIAEIMERHQNSKNAEDKFMAQQHLMKSMFDINPAQQRPDVEPLPPLGR